MNLFITISTENYLKYTFLLYNSLITTNPKAHLKIFCDSRVFVKFFKDKPRCEAILLPEIRTRGVARARFHMYYKSCNIPFVYLDSDIIVLKNLSELFENNRFAACLDDTQWNKYSDPQLPHDHFMNAYLACEKIKVTGLDRYKYNWQGLVSDSGYAVKLVNNELINTKTNRPLSLAHLIGKIPPDTHIRQMPEDIGVFLLKMGLPEKNNSENEIGRTYGEILKMYFNAVTGVNVDEEQFTLEDDFFNIIINPFSTAITANRKESVKVKIEITNKSKYYYTSESHYPVNISYHIYDHNNVTIVFDGLRTRLPFDLEPNRSVTVEIFVLTPARPGTYLLEYDLVKEGVSWFKLKNDYPYKKITLKVI